MAVSTGNIVQAALADIQMRFVEKKRVGLDFNALFFLFGLAEMEDLDATMLQDMADYFDALAWVGRVHIVWRSPSIVLLPPEAA